jgi:lipopolysaccharide export LptBFGC system permease protein LptF
MAKTKKKLIINYENLPPAVVEALNNKYPDGLENHVIRVDKGNGDFFYGVTIDTKDTSYLVKVNVTVDSNIDDLDEKIFDSSQHEENNLMESLDEEPASNDDSSDDEN